MNQRWHDHIKRAVGRVGQTVAPLLGRVINLDRFPKTRSRIAESIRYSRLLRAGSREDLPSVEAELAAFWTGDRGDRFHSQWNDARLTHFLSEHAHVVERFAEMVALSGFHFSRIVEIGCGDGTVLENVSQRLASIPKFIGIDINAEVITGARDRFKRDPRLDFLHGDAKVWLEQNAEAGTVVLTNGGVLEYFSPDSVARLFATLAHRSPAAVILIEPRSPDHDFEAEPKSFLFGSENSFSHNYVVQLRANGFTVDSCEFMKTVYADWVLVIAYIGGP